jgi:hypothetical protein
LCSPGNFTQIRWERYPLGDDGAELRALGRFERPIRGVLEGLGDYDLIVDATANSKVFN